MRKMLVFFLLFIAAIWLGLQLQRDQGYVLITLNHWTIETTVWVTLFIFLLVFIIFHLLLVSYHWIGNLPGRYKGWKNQRRAHKAQLTTRRGLIEFSEGEWSAAQNHLIKALPNTDTPLLNYLTAARAAQEMGNYQLRDTHLRDAQQAVPDAKIAVELTQAQLQIADKQWEQALATLKHLHDLSPNHPYVIKLLMHLYQEVKDWPQLISLLPKIKKNKVATGLAYQKLCRHAYLQAMFDLIKLHQTDEIKNLFNHTPKFLKEDPTILGIYCDYLIRNKEKTAAEPLLRAFLQKNFHDTIIYLYGTIYINNKQIKFVEGLLKKYPANASLYLALGQLCMSEALWGKAKNYLEKSISLDPSPQAYEQLGLLFDKLNEVEAAKLAYKNGLKLIHKSTAYHLI